MQAKAQIIPELQGERRQWRKREPKQGQRSQSAKSLCPRSTMRVPQPDIIVHFGNADAAPRSPDRRLSRKAGIVRYCHKQHNTYRKRQENKDAP